MGARGMGEGPGQEPATGTPRLPSWRWMDFDFDQCCGAHRDWRAPERGDGQRTHATLELRTVRVASLFMLAAVPGAVSGAVCCSGVGFHFGIKGKKKKKKKKKS